ncbi:hypothetical protein ACFX10_010455 [Malus domestica]
MASRKAQTVPATGAKNKSVLVASGVTLGITTRSMARATSATSFTSASTLSREQKHPRHEPLITLASLRAPRGESPRKYSESMLSDADSSDSSAMQVMTIGATSIDEQLAQMNEAIARLTRTVEEKDLQIAALVSRLEPQDDENPNPEDEPQVEKNDAKPEPDQAAALMGSLSIQQLQEMITNTIKAQYEGSSNTSELYSKPYSKKIDALRMPRGYQPPKFMQFDGKGNPKQHVAHFVETCNNAGTEGDYLAKQFVRSLKGNAFEWYTDLEPESINSWEQLEREFLNRFYSTRRTVSMLELTSTKQWKDEPVIDYINRWRTLSLDCKDRLSETSSIEMCIQGMQWGLQYILQGIKPRTFEELATRAHDMELSIAHHGKKEPIANYKNDKVLETKVEKATWKSTKEAMTVNKAPVKIPTRGKAIQTKAFRDQEMRRRTLKELEEKIYPFPDSDVVAMLDDLLDKKVISLPECRRPEEVNHTDNPRYCKFHRFISHPTEKCFVLKDLILKLAQQGKIELDLEDTVAVHTTTIVFESLDPVHLRSMHDHSCQCSSHMAPPTQPSPGASNQDASTGDKKGWTSVTYKKTRKPIPQATRPKDKPKPAPRTSVFERLNYSKPRIAALDRISGRYQNSVFKRLETPTPQRSVFERLSKPKKQSGTARSPPQRSALDRREETKKPSRNRKTTPKGDKLDSLAGKDDVQSLIPSRMKRQSTLEVDTKGPLKVRRRTIIYTGQSSRQRTQEDRTGEKAQEDKEDEILEEDVTSGSVNSKSSPQSLGACSKNMPVKPSEVEGWTYVTPKKLHKKHMSSPQAHQWERGQNSSCSPLKQCESVGDNETLTRRSSIPITMRDIFPEDFFNYSVKAPCYEDCEERLSQIA